MNFILGSKVILAFEPGIGSKEHASAAVLEQDWLAGSDNLSLHLESAVRVCVVEHPDGVGIGSAGVHECNLVA